MVKWAHKKSFQKGGHMTHSTPNSLIPIQSLHQQALETARRYLLLEKDLLEIIIEIEKRKAFRQLGYNSLYTYVNEGLKLSPATSYRPKTF